MHYDVFVSHSSYDKEEVARPLAEALQSLGLAVWLDEEQLHVGDSIRRGIDDALRDSKFGVVILSSAYLDSEWGQKELDAFFAKEKYQNKSILPIYHGITVEDVEQHWPTLADKISLNTSFSTKELAESIRVSIQKTTNQTKECKPHTIRKHPKGWQNISRQWLFGILLIAGGLVAIVTSGKLGRSSSNIINVVNNQDQVGDVFVGDKIETQVINHNQTIDAKELAEQIIQNSVLTTQEVIEAKEEEIKRLTKTIEDLQKSPSDEYKQQALAELASGDIKKAQTLLELSLAEREKAREAEAKQMSADWLNIGNISYFHDSQKALRAYKKALEFDSDNIYALGGLGRVYHRLGEWDKALVAYEKYFALAVNVGDEVDLASAYVYLGSIYISFEKLDKAEKHILKALEAFESIGNQIGMANQYGNLGGIYALRNEFGKAEEFYQKALEVHDGLGDLRGVASSNLNLGSVYYKQGGKLDESEKSFLNALKVIKSLNAPDLLASSYSGLGKVYLLREELNKGEQFHLKALKVYEDIGDQLGIASVNLDLGDNYLLRQELDQAEKFYTSTITIHEKLGIKQFGGESRLTNSYIRLGLLYSQQGTFYFSMGELSKAEELHLKALKINESINDPSLASSSCRELGAIYLTQRLMDKAEKFLLRALEIDEKHGTKRNIASSSGNLGLVYYLREELTKAENFQLKALETHKEVGNKQGIAASYDGLWLVYYARKELIKAKGYLVKTLEINTSIGRKERMAVNHSNLGSVYEELGEINDACKSWEKSASIYFELGLPELVEVETWIKDLCPAVKPN